ncbi:MAG: FAD-dependent oxidoreductase [Dehalococcoidia bacterium]|jgi:2,4-dienoyl-CoA reductase-like NADH-dependent reductase (Old Yellow Enzyme family)/thioredoxin reductase|nr:FAD-dependent oxidoreductase [Dehalococcoidia bacterium]
MTAAPAQTSTARSAEFPHLFSPLKVGPGEFKNRVYSPPHAPGFMGYDFLPGDQLIAYWEAKARGGTAAISTGVTPVHPSTGMQVVPFRNPNFADRYNRAAEAMHRHDALFFVQPWHGGTQVGGVGGRASWAPSAVVTPHNYGVPHVMTRSDIDEIIEAWRFAGQELAKTDVDGIEIHGAHGYLITEFSSGFFNRRDDEYGGDEERRSRFVREIIAAVRSEARADQIVGMRFSADEFVDEGLTVEESQRLLKRLADTGDLDYLNISVGNYQSMETIIAPMYVPLSSFVYAAAAIKEVVDIPVFTVGRINDPQQAEQIIAGGYADVVSMNRAIIADPDWANKALTGRSDEIRKCIACNEACWGRGEMGLPIGIGCAVNPDIGFEEDMILTPAETKKTVMVIGGGVAGLEAARVAAERGHTVSVYERGDELGGQVLTAGKASMRIDFAEPARYYTVQMDRLGVDVHLGEEVTMATVDAAKPDVVVVATGSTPIIPDDVPGADGPNVTEVRAVLDGEVEVGHRVLLAASENHQEGLATVEFLLDRGHEVTVVSKREAPGQEIEHNTIVMLMPRVVEKGAQLEPLTWVRRIDGDTVTLYSLITGEDRSIEVDTVVFACGGESDNAIYQALQGRVPDVQLVGDALAPRRMLYATRDGNRVGKAI